MYSILNGGYDTRSLPTATYPDMRRILDGIKGNHLKTVTRARHGAAVRSDHLLVTLVRTFAPLEDEALMSYITRVRRTFTERAHKYGLNTYQHKALTIPSSSFFSDNVEEVLLGTVGDVDPFRDQSRWSDLEPIVIHAHPDTSINFNPLNNHSSDDGYAVISIDISKLCLMYWCWIHTTEYKNAEFKPTTMMFIGRYVLPTALRSYVEITFINRLIAHYYEDELYPIDNINPWYLTDWDVDFDDYIFWYLDDIKRRTTITYEEILHNIPTLGDETALERFTIPSVPVTRYSTWILTLMRLRYVNFLVDVTLNNDNQANLHHNASILVDVREAVRDRDLVKSLSGDNADIISDILKDIPRKLKGHS